MHQRMRAQLGAQPQVGRQVVVAQRHLRAVAYAFLAQLCRRTGRHLMAQRLRQDDDVAQLQARDDEGRLQLPGLACRAGCAHHDRLLGRAPVIFNALLCRRRQAAKPRQVAGQRQGLGQPLGLQALHHFRFVKRCHGGLHLRRDLLRGRCLGLVAGGFHGCQHVVQTLRHIQEGRTEVAFPQRVVVDHHRHAALCRWRLLQPHQGCRLVGHGVDLAGDRQQRAAGGVARGDQHGINHAGEFARRVVIGNVAERQPVPALRPFGRVLRQRRHGLQHRHADALELGLAFGRVEDQRGVDDDVGHAPPARSGGNMRGLEEQVFLLARAVEGIGAQAALLERGNQRVQPAGVGPGENRVVDGDCYCFRSSFLPSRLGQLHI